MNNLKMTPSKELLEFAKEKSKMLVPNQAIRLKGGDYEISYYLFNLLGAVYIGSYTNEPLKNFFKNKQAYEFTDNNKFIFFCKISIVSPPKK